MSFGIISILIDEHAKIIQKLILEKIDPTIIEVRRIFCGNSSHSRGVECVTAKDNHCKIVHLPENENKLFI